MWKILDAIVVKLYFIRLLITRIHESDISKSKITCNFCYKALLFWKYTSVVTSILNRYLSRILTKEDGSKNLEHKKVMLISKIYPEFFKKSISLWLE